MHALNFEIILLGMLTLAQIALAALLWRARSGMHPARCYALLLMAIAVYCGAFIFLLELPTLDQKILASNIEYLGVCIAPGGYLVFALRFLGLTRYTRPWHILAYLSIGILTIVFKWTNFPAGAVFSSVGIEMMGEREIFVFGKGGWYWVFIIYEYIICLVGAGLLLQTGRFFPGFPLSRALLLASLPIAPLAAHAVRLMGYSPWGELDVVPYAISVSTILSALAILRHHTMELAPIARTFVVEHLPMGILVFDERWVAVDATEPTRRILGADACRIGQTWRDLAAILGAAEEPPDNGAQWEFPLGRSADGAEAPTYQARVERITAGPGSTGGFVLTLQDVSARQRLTASLEDLLRRREAELSTITRSMLGAGELERQRIGLTIHDTVCQELTALVRMADSLRVQGTETVPATMERLAEQARRASRLARDLSHTLSIDDIGADTFITELRSFAASVERSLGIRCTVEASAEVLPLARRAVDDVFRIIREAVFNAVRHAETTDITIHAAESAGQIRIAVENNGRALPPSGTLTEGVGLRGMRARARQLDATLRFAARTETPEREGGLVELSIPAAQP